MALKKATEVVAGERVAGVDRPYYLVTDTAISKRHGERDERVVLWFDWSLIPSIHLASEDFLFMYEETE